MHEVLQDEVVERAWHDPEVVDALAKLASGDNTKMAGFHRDLGNRLRAAWGDMLITADAEAQAYTKADIAYVLYTMSEVETTDERRVAEQEALERAEIQRAAQEVENLQHQLKAYSGASRRHRRHLRAEVYRAEIRYAQIAGEAEARIRELQLSSSPPRQSGDWEQEAAAAKATLEAARESLVRSLHEKAALPITRAWINTLVAEDKKHRYRLEFDTADAPGLRQMTAAEHEIPTTAFERLSILMRQMGGGAIGISGPRGAGKTTLIQSVCRNRRWLGDGSKSIGIFVPAPVEYVPREFLLHLFATLCLRVEPTAAERMRTSLRRPKSPLGRPFVFAAGAAVLVGGTVLLGLALSSLAVTRDGLAGMAVVVALLMAGLLAPRLRYHHLEIDWEHDASFGRRPDVQVVVLVGMAGVVCGGLATWLQPDRLLSLAGTVAIALVTLTAMIQQRLRRIGPADVGIAVTLVLMVTYSTLTGTVPSSLFLAGELFLVVGVGARLIGVVAMGRAPLARVLLPWGSGLVEYIAMVAALALLAAGVWKAAVDPRLVWGALLAVTGWLAVPVSHVLGLEVERAEHERRMESRLTATQQILRKITFQQTITQGWSEAWKVGAIAQSPLAVERTATGGESLASTPWTYPEIVAEFHQFAARLTRDGTALIIGIDELDKLEPQAAQRFINEVKAIFHGTAPHCYYLVSVSEEALASFQQRGLAARDVFDTAFDEMLHIDHLTIEGTISLLGKRVIDLPVGVAALCHVVSGGLPRDVVRAMRMAVATRKDRTSIPLGELAREMCEQELASQLQGMRTVMRALGDWRAVADLEDWAGQLSLTDLATIRNYSKSLVGEAKDESEALRLLRAHACSYYHLATIAQFFAATDSATIEQAEKDMDDLARARTGMSASWVQAWQRVTRFRDRWDLEPKMTARQWLEDE